jgi:transcription elongation GreA/GreB family factor
LKEKIISELLRKVRDELSGVQESLDSSKNLATDQEFKAEGKYDTRALEASYLASAESKRVEELKLEIQILQEVDLNASQRLGEISIGALVELSFNHQVRKYFLIPTSGGSMIEVEGETVLVVSVFSPVGDALMGLKAGDEFEVETPKENRHYKVLSFC